MGLTPALVKDRLYEVGVRRIVNRPQAVTVERLRYVGIGSGKSIWLPEYENFGQKPVHLAIDQIASLEEA